MPEALTKWKLNALAHSKELALGFAQRSVVTQKELMVQPNVPRFVREGDSVWLSAKVVNLGSKEISGQAQLQLLNATTMNPVDGWFKNTIPQKPFIVAAGQSAAVKFNIVIPANYNNALVYRIVAKASTLAGGMEGASDGEEAAIPVLTNRMLVTETMPLPVKMNQAKSFTLSLQNPGSFLLKNRFQVFIFLKIAQQGRSISCSPLIEYGFNFWRTFNDRLCQAVCIKAVEVLLRTIIGILHQVR